MDISIAAMVSIPIVYEFHFYISTIHIAHRSLNASLKCTSAWPE
jgi:hypothetical protein